jgi:UDPglucose 6-dehydrogenase
MRRIAVVGTGHVGLVTGACLADLGNSVVCIDSDASRIGALLDGRMPFHEPGLQQLVAGCVGRGTLEFGSDLRDGIVGAECIFIAVGTPAGPDGSCDLEALRAVARDIGRRLVHDVVVVNKSTVPVATGDLVATIIREHRRMDLRVEVAYNPEFTREGSAIRDFMNPDRIVIGSGDPRATALLKDLYAPLRAPLIVTDVKTAEMIKCSANAFLATKISFVNEIASLCERIGVDVNEVAFGIGGDPRIGSAFLDAGIGFGGSCLPKDLLTMVLAAQRSGVPFRLLPAVLAVNDGQVARLVDTLEATLGGLFGRHVGVLGLSFKPDTDDVRESPSLKLIDQLLARGASVSVHDPVAAIPSTSDVAARVGVAADCYEAANEADAVVVATAWEEYRQLNWSLIRKLMRGVLIVDGRNLYDDQELREHGLRHLGIGRSRRDRDAHDNAAIRQAVDYA